ncbi:MAG: thiamine pyrophosphate-binding protein [Pseudomonadota bacterium]
MSSKTMRGADWLLSGLKEAGVKTIFSLSGNQIMPVYDAALDADVRLIHTRHEGAAVYMAEAAAQLTGEVGVALLTAGPGFANALSAMYTAKESETALVVLSGDSPRARDRHGAFQELDQCAAAAPMVKASFRARAGVELKTDIQRAIALAKHGRPGPVHLALPDDVLRQTGEQSSESCVVKTADLEPLSAEQISTIGEAVQAAERPMIVLGPDFCRPGAKADVAATSKQLNVPCIAFESPRGLRAPRLGAFAEVLGNSDLIIAIGKPLNFMVGFGDDTILHDGCRVIQIDPDASVLSQDHARLGNRLALQVQSDARQALTEIREKLTKHPTNGWVEEVEAAISYRPASWDEESATPASIGPVQFAKAIAPWVSKSPDASFIVDGGEIGQWCQALLDSHRAMINGPSGAIGGSIPYAIGAKAVRPEEPAITIMGDGTAGFYLAEFETAVRENTPLVAIIGNDAKWNAEHQIQIREFGADRTHSCELTAARYDRVAAELGGHGEFVTSFAELGPALERAFAANKPACVNVMIEGEAAPTIKRAG